MKTSSSASILVIAMAVLAWAAQVRAQNKDVPAINRSPDARDADASGIGRNIANLRFVPLDGAAVTLDKLLEGRRAVVIAMTSAECPIARKYAPRIAALESTFAGKVAFVHVNTVDGETTETMRAAIRAFTLRGPYATDASGDIRRELRPSTTTEVFVLDSARKLVYRGAVDDQYRVGGAAAKATQSFLKEALNAVIEGKAPKTQATAAPGCIIDMPREIVKELPAPKPERSRLTYYPAVAKIVAANCIDCHRLGGNAPFSLESPGSAQGRSAMIAAVVREGLMPPTHGLRAGDAGPLVFDRAMKQEDRETLIAWLQSGHELGNAPPAPAREARSEAANTWTIGRPDLILTTPGPSLPADGPLQYGRYLVPVNLDGERASDGPNDKPNEGTANESGDRWIEAIECRTVMRDAVEHALIWIIPPGGAVPVSGATPPAPELLATYSRSDTIARYTTGSARRFAPGSLLVADIFARPMGKPSMGQLRIGMKFAEAPPSRQLHSMVIGAGPFLLPAGVPDSRVETSATLESPARIVAIQPYLGARGHELHVSVETPGVPARTLLDLSRYDWRWQIRYVLREPILVPAGSRLVIRGRFDNSAANPANPDSSREVPMGIGLEKEALIVSVEYETP